MKATLVSVEEYLHSSYEVDCDYVDGELVEREVGERDHSQLQGHILAYYLSRRRKWGIYPFVEQRVGFRSAVIACRISASWLGALRNRSSRSHRWRFLKFFRREIA